MNTEHLENVVVEFSEIANKQEKKGIAKYGKPLDPLDKYDWLNMANEELVDAYKYFIAEKIKRKYYIDKIRKLSDDPDINHWLDELEGKNMKE